MFDLSNIKRNYLGTQIWPCWKERKTDWGCMFIIKNLNFFQGYLARITISRYILKYNLMNPGWCILQEIKYQLIFAKQILIIDILKILPNLLKLFLKKILKNLNLMLWKYCMDILFWFRYHYLDIFFENLENITI